MTDGSDAGRGQIASRLARLHEHAGSHWQVLIGLSLFVLLAASHFWLQFSDTFWVSATSAPEAQQIAERVKAQETAIQTQTIILFWLSSAMGILFALRMQETRFGWFALGILAAALYNQGLPTSSDPMQSAVAGQVGMIYLLFSLYCLTLTKLLIANIDATPHARWSLGLAICGLLLLVSSYVWEASVLRWGQLLWLGATAICCLNAFVDIVSTLWRRRQRTLALFLCVATLFVAAAVLHDALPSRDPQEIAAPRRLSSFALFSVIVSQAWFILTQFAGALGALEAINSDLDRRIRARELELYKLHAAQVIAEREQTLAKERDRLMQDMHDGIAGRLFTTLARLDEANMNLTDVREEIHGCLEDVRLTIESLDEQIEDFASLLGSFRYQIAPRLRRKGITMHWQVADLPFDLKFAPETNLQVLRILQEAITNVLRHAAADQVTLAATLGEGQLCLTVTDNGVGCAGDTERQGAPSGRGLDNMHRRALAVQGELHIRQNCGRDETGPKGTTVQLTIPLAQNRVF